MTCIAVLFTSYGPYHLARLGGFYKWYSSLFGNIVGLELARQEVEYAWETKVEGFPFKIVSVIEDQQLEQAKFHQLIVKLHAVLSQLNPDILVIAGYARPAMLAALLWSLCRRKPAILVSETKQDDAPRFWWSESIKRWILKH